MTGNSRRIPVFRRDDRSGRASVDMHCRTVVVGDVGHVHVSQEGKLTQHGVRVVVPRLVRRSCGELGQRGEGVAADGRPEPVEHLQRVGVILDHGAMDPRMSVYSAVSEPYAVHRTVPRRQRRARVAQQLDEVGLPAPLIDRYPHQLSGGQRQRVVIARALALEPRLLVLDEPTSALDVTVQERVLQLVERLRAERGLAYLLISHNLAVVDRPCESSVVLYQGVVMERGAMAVLLSQPVHPYTRALRAAVPEIGVQRPPLSRISSGKLPLGTVSACAYVERCPLAIDRCRTEAPVLRPVDGRDVPCHRAEDTEHLTPG